jgi:hypothetical protein
MPLRKRDSSILAGSLTFNFPKTLTAEPFLPRSAPLFPTATPKQRALGSERFIGPAVKRIGAERRTLRLPGSSQRSVLPARVQLKQEVVVAGHPRAAQHRVGTTVIEQDGWNEAGRYAFHGSNCS